MGRQVGMHWCLKKVNLGGSKVYQIPAHLNWSPGTSLLQDSMCRITIAPIVQWLGQHPVGHGLYGMEQPYVGLCHVHCWTTWLFMWCMHNVPANNFGSRPNFSLKCDIQAVHFSSIELNVVLNCTIYDWLRLGRWNSDASKEKEHRLLWWM